MLLYSVPAPSSVVPESPTQIQLGFSEAVEPDLSSVRLFDAAREEITLKHPSHGTNDRSVLTVNMPALSDGTYVVVWRATSVDGHPVEGAFPFSVGESTVQDGSGFVSRVLDSVAEKSPLGFPLAVSRFIAFAGLVLLLGSLSLSWGTRHLESERVIVAGLLGVVLSLFGAVTIFLLQGAWVTGGGWKEVVTLSSTSEVVSTRLGTALAVRVVFVLLWCAFIQHLRRKSWSRRSSIVGVVLTVGLALTFALSGHPAVEHSSLLFVPVDVLHLLAVGTWAGGLVVLTIARREITAGPHGGLVVGRFSQSATVALPLAIVTGVAQSLHLAGDMTTWSDSDYGRYLIGKAALAVVVVALGVRARRIVRAGRGSDLGWLIRTEAAIAVVVLVLTAGLVSTSPLGDVPRTFTASLVENNVIADVSIVPPRTGAVEIHVVFSPPGGGITPVGDVRVRVELPSRGVPHVPVPMSEIGPNHWSGSVQFPYAGDWTLEVLASPAANTQIRYSAVIPVED
jgi:copper transport protein